MSQIRSPAGSPGRTKGEADWSRAKHRMPASFTDQPRRDAPVQGRRDDGLDLVAAVTGALALTAVAELAADDAPAREDAVGVNDEEVLAAQSESVPEQETDSDDDDD